MPGWSSTMTRTSSSTATRMTNQSAGEPAARRCSAYRREEPELRTTGPTSRRDRSRCVGPHSTTEPMSVPDTLQTDRGRAAGQAHRMRDELDDEDPPDEPVAQRVTAGGRGPGRPDVHGRAGDRRPAAVPRGGLCASAGTAVRAAAGGARRWISGSARAGCASRTARCWPTPAESVPMHDSSGSPCRRLVDAWHQSEECRSSRRHNGSWHVIGPRR